MKTCMDIDLMIREEKGPKLTLLYLIVLKITDGQDIPIYDNDGNIVGYKRSNNQQTIESVRTLPINPETTNTKSKKSLNGSIVKAIKNL